MTSFDEAQHPREHDGKFAEKERGAPEVSLATGPYLSYETPEGIDERLADIYGRLAHQRERRASAERSIERNEAYLQRLSGASGDYYARIVANSKAEVADADERIATLRQESAPFEDEFDRRGGWPRAFLVSGGHVHRSMSCSTCHPTTRFHWMTNYSGKTEDDIVGDAGERACTVCYPSAPVETLGQPTKMFTPDETAAAEAREKRAAEKAAREIDRTNKAIAMPDGSDLRDEWGHPVKTLVTAERNLVSSLAYYVVAVEQGRTSYENQEWLDDHAAARERAIEAIAHKKGITKDAVLAEAREKAEKKVKREWR